MKNSKSSDAILQSKDEENNLEDTVLQKKSNSHSASPTLRCDTCERCESFVRQPKGFWFLADLIHQDGEVIEFTACRTCQNRVQAAVRALLRQNDATVRIYTSAKLGSFTDYSADNSEDFFLSGYPAYQRSREFARAQKEAANLEIDRRILQKLQSVEILETRDPEITCALSGKVFSARTEGEGGKKLGFAVIVRDPRIGIASGVLFFHRSVLSEALRILRSLLRAGDIAVHQYRKDRENDNVARAVYGPANWGELCHIQTIGVIQWTPVWKREWEEAKCPKSVPADTLGTLGDVLQRAGVAPRTN